jgi:pimeloyl-ACP methyl ester carboxylesterase
LADVLARHPVRVDPLFGVPLAGAGRIEHEGAGSVSISGYRPGWGATAPASLAEAMARVVDLEQQPTAQIAVTAITGADGVRRFVVELPGIRELASRRQPQDLVGAIDAMAGSTTTYTRCVWAALDRAQVPLGAQVMLVGHSDGGIVAMDLASDPRFNGSRVQVTHVVAAGSPISGKDVAPNSSTRVLSVENVNDVVTHLDGVDSADRAPTLDRLAYEYSDDEHGAGRNHSGTGYVEHMVGLATSPNPLMHSFQTSAQPYLWSLPGSTTTMVFTLTDSAAGE